MPRYYSHKILKDRLKGCKCFENVGNLNFTGSIYYNSEWLTVLLQKLSCKVKVKSAYKPVAYQASAKKNILEFGALDIYGYPFMYTCMETEAVRVKYLAHEHNTMSPGRTWTWTPWSRRAHTYHDEATAHPTAVVVLSQFCNDWCKVHFVSWVRIVSSKHFIVLICFLQQQFSSILLVYH